MPVWLICVACSYSARGYVCGKTFHLIYNYANFILDCSIKIRIYADDIHSQSEVMCHNKRGSVSSAQIKRD